MPTALRRELVPSSVLTRLSLVIPPTSMGNRNFRDLWREGWTKIGTLPAQKVIHFFREECSNSANFMPVSVWQTVHKNFQTPLVRSPADRTKVVTMAALLKFDGLAMFLLLIFSRLSSGFSAVPNCFQFHWAQSCCPLHLFNWKFILLPIWFLFSARRIRVSFGWGDCRE